MRYPPTFNGLNGSVWDPEQILAKAMVSDQYSGSDPFSGTNFSIGANQIENLQSLMTVQTGRLDECKLWRRFWKQKKTNYTWQYNKMTSRGGDAGTFSQFVTEGQIGRTYGTTRERKSRTIKFIAENGQVSLQATLPTLGGMQYPAGEMSAKSLIADETNQRVQHLLIQLEKTLFWANKDILGTKSFDGVIMQMVREAATDDLVAGQIRDCHNRPLHRQFIEDGMSGAIDNHLVNTPGRVVLMAAPDTLTGYALQLDAKERVGITVNPETGFVTGTPVRGHNTQSGGFVPFEQNIHLVHPATRDGVPAVDRGEPGATLASPTSVTPADAGVDADSNILPEDEATWYYTVTSIDDNGEQATGTVSAGVAAIRGHAIEVSIVEGAGATPTGFRIYRGLRSDGADHEFVTAIARTAATTVFTDTNYWMPGCMIAVQVALAEDDAECAQMADLIRFNLASTDTSYRFVLLYFLDVAIKAHRKWVVYRNIQKNRGRFIDLLEAAP